MSGAGLSLNTEGQCWLSFCGSKFTWKPSVILQQGEQAHSTWGLPATTFASADMAWGTLHCVLPGLTDLQSLSQEPFPWAGAWPGVRFICHASFGYFGRGQPRSALLSKMIYHMEFKFSFSTFEQDVMPLVIQTPCVKHAISPTFAYSLFKQTELWGLSGIPVAPSPGVLTGVLSCTPLAQQGV